VRAKPLHILKHLLHPLLLGLHPLLLSQTLNLTLSRHPFNHLLLGLNLSLQYVKETMAQCYNAEQTYVKINKQRTKLK
jgi:hypothetical protein